MSRTVCLLANTIEYPEGGGHLWVYLNWALGLRALGCRVIWLETIGARTPQQRVRVCATKLKERLAPYGIADALAIGFGNGEQLPAGWSDICLDVNAARAADLLLNFQYSARAEFVAAFKRSALVDIDPGLLQTWMHAGHIKVAPHDIYFTTGETIGQPGSHLPDCGIAWHYIPPCVALDWWPVAPSQPGAAFTTVSHWWAEEFMEDAETREIYRNDKRAGFLPFLDLPRRTRQPLELALCLADDDEGEWEALLSRGWRVRRSADVSSTPWDYQRYAQASRGEFSCAKPSCIRLQNAWISDRTICYLASGKPAVVQHTGRSRFLPDSEGLFRFRDISEAAVSLEKAADDYEHHCQLARDLAATYFDARKVVRAVLERSVDG